MIDELDVQILNILQENAKISRSQIAETVGLSVPAVSERLHKLEEKKIIEGYYTRVNKKSFGYDITSFILVISGSSLYYENLVQKACEHKSIIEVHSVLGEGSHMLKAIAKNTAELEKLLAEIQSWPGVVSTKTIFILSSRKETTNINIS